MTVSQIFFTMTLVLYSCATLAYLVFLARTRPLSGIWAGRLIQAGFVAHILATIHRFNALGHLPITNLGESLSFFSLALVAAFIFFERNYQVAILGSFASPLALVMLAASTSLPQGAVQLHPVLKSGWFWIHTLFAFVSYAAFTISGGVAVMYLLQQRFLKKKYFGSLFQKLPSLETLDDINYRCLAVGFPLLTVTIISGAIWLEQAIGSYWNWDPKQTWSLITWFIYAALLHGRLTIGWRGRMAALLSIAGFIVLLVTFIGMKHGITW